MTSDLAFRPQLELDDRYTARSGEVLMSGIQALVRITLDQRRLDKLRGHNTGLFVSGYEGSPLGGLDLEMARARRYLDEARVIFRPGVNEELAATAVAGTQSIGSFPGRRVDGITGCWYGKNPGLDRAADAIRHGNLSGTAPLGGAVAWIGDDPASKSSTVPSSCLPMCRSLMVPVLTPGTIEEILTMGLHAIAMSRHSGTWVGMQIVTDVADASDTVDVGRAMATISALELEPRPNSHPALMLPPGNLDVELDLMENRLIRASDYATLTHLNDVVFEPAHPRIALVGVGFGYQAIVRALDELQVNESECQRLGLRLVQLGMPWPLNADEVRRLCGGVETVLVVEDKLEFVETLIRDALYRTVDAPVVVGKHDATGAPLLPLRAFLTADDVARALNRIVHADEWSTTARERLVQLHPRQRITLSLAPQASRTPFFCSGCPHNVSTRAGEGQLVGLGIGCHSLANMDHGSRRGHLTGITQMGGEGAQWLGLAPFTDDPHFIQNLGDGTFHHSGSLAVRAAVAGGVTMTYKLLYNDAVAMTGGQQPQGKLDVPNLSRLLEAEGVVRIIITTPEPSLYANVKLAAIAEVRHRDEFQAAQLELAEVAGVTVLIHDDRCAAEKRRMRKRGLLEMPAERVLINERVCEGCGDCGEQSTCLSLIPVATEFGRKTQVHQSSCNFDKSCLKGNCPSFVLITPKSGPKRLRAIPAPPNDMPMPELRVPENALLRLPGVGGTGVVTMSAILQMAAYLDGLYAAGLDQIGLAQKGGPVISDVRISRNPIRGQLRASAYSVDVILGLDILGAAAAETLAVADPRRTVAVLNTSVTPTAAMVTDASLSPFAESRVIANLAEVTRRDENVLVDAGGIAEVLFGDHFAANMILAGAAYQHGCIPISAEAIERAIGLNGASVDANLLAFRWGRAAIAAPEAIVAAITGPQEVKPPDSFAHSQVEQRGFAEDLVAILVLHYSELSQYQDRKYAERYLDNVERIFKEERSVREEGGFPLTSAYAKGLFKLMAYKDEYEVARLHLNERENYRNEYGLDAKVKILLHPPSLKAMGMKKKIRLGRSAFLSFRILHAVRRVRGTKLDPFGYAEMRKIERGLVEEYRRLLENAVTMVTLENLGLVVSLAELPDMIRGYDDVKIKNIEDFRRRCAELMGQITLNEPYDRQAAVSGT
jgi:indolepyruvate ferredoxin oxidoreductase